MSGNINKPGQNRCRWQGRLDYEVVTELPEEKHGVDKCCRTIVIASELHKIFDSKQCKGYGDSHKYIEDDFFGLIIDS